MGTKALVLFSGGLDSMLAAETLRRQGIEAVPLCFESNFFNAMRAGQSADRLGLELRTVDISSEELELVKNPPSGYGRNMNPCIDCHAMMVRKAARIAREEGFDLVATGEVLGQRPFSQTAAALKRVEDLAGCEVLRPLSARLLPETEMEKAGLAKRHRLHAIKGRSREEQMALAEKYGITKYPSPAGGCLLTDREYSERLARLLDTWPKSGVNEAELIKNGRVFWFIGTKGKKVLAVVGRDHEENENLKKLAKTGDIMVELREINGPTTLIRGIKEKIHNSGPELLIPDKLSGIIKDMDRPLDGNGIIERACLLTGYYATKARGAKASFKANPID